VAFPAHKIIGNIPYVGTGTLNAYLVTTPEGHILINTNFEETVPLLRQSIEQLGFRLSGKPHPIDRTLKDGEQVRLGGTTLTAHLTPGHTRGCTTWETTVQEGGRSYNVVIACAGLQENARLVNNQNYPEIADDFARAIKKYRTMKPDVFLASHSWFFDLAGKHTRLATSATNPYIDPAGFRAWVDKVQKNYDTMLAEQKRNPPVELN